MTVTVIAADVYVDVIVEAEPAVDVIEEGFIGPPGPQGPPGPVGATGPEGPQGPAGGSSASYRHVQGVPLATWTIVHNLGYRPNITTLANMGTLVEVIGNITHTNTSTAVVVFATAVTGEALAS